MSGPLVSGGASGLYQSNPQAMRSAGPSAYDVARRLKMPEVAAIVQRTVVAYGRRPAGHPIELDAEQVAALALAGIDEAELATRIAHERSRLRDQLAATARRAAEDEAQLAAAKAAYLSTHEACTTKERRRIGAPCLEACMVARSRWRQVATLTSGPGSPRAALEDLQRLAVPHDLKRRLSDARSEVARLRRERQATAERLHAEEGRGPREAKALRENLHEFDNPAAVAKRIGELESGQVSAGPVRVLTAKIATLDAAIGRAEATVRECEAERDRLVAEAVGVLAEPEPAAPAKRRKGA